MAIKKQETKDSIESNSQDSINQKAAQDLADSIKSANSDSIKNTNTALDSIESSKNIESEFKSIPTPQEILELEKTIRDFTAPKELFYVGDLNLLNAPKLAIIGTRSPNPYASSFTRTLAAKAAQRGIVIVSGGALGIDIIAHEAAKKRTIMISPSSLDVIYPPANKEQITKIYQNALVLSQFPAPRYLPYKFSFLERNKIVVALCSAVVIPQADIKSGSAFSASFAMKIKKPLFVPPHRIGESSGTNKWAKNGSAQILWDIDEFLDYFLENFARDYAPNLGLDSIESSPAKQEIKEILDFCASAPLFNDAFLKFGEILFELELQGQIIRKNGRIEVAP